MTIRREIGVLSLVGVVACATSSAEPWSSEELPCVPNETRCSGERQYTTCARDGLSRSTSPCSEGMVCISSLPGARCTQQPSNSRTLSQNYEATLRLSMPGGGHCTAFLISDDVAVTNHHCCAEEPRCTGPDFRFEGRYRSDEAEDDISSHGVAPPNGPVTSAVEILLAEPSLDVIVLRLEQPIGADLGNVVLARGRSYGRAPVYVMGHPSGRPIESSLGILYGYREYVDYRYASGTKRKVAQLLYGARAEPGSSGSPVFLSGTNALVAVHHTGNLDVEDVGETLERTEGFDRLLGATDAEAIAQALEMHGIEFEELQVE